MAQSAQVDPVEKKIRLVRYWTFGIFLLAFAAETTMLGLFDSNPMAIITFGWPMWLATFIPAAVVFFGYPIWARRNAK